MTSYTYEDGRFSDLPTDLQSAILAAATEYRCSAALEASHMLALATDKWGIGERFYPTPSQQQYVLEQRKHIALLSDFTGNTSPSILELLDRVMGLPSSTDCAPSVVEDSSGTGSERVSADLLPGAAAGSDRSAS